MKDIKEFALAFKAMRDWFGRVNDFYTSYFKDVYYTHIDRICITYTGRASGNGEIQAMLSEVLTHALKGHKWTLEAMTITVAGYTIAVTYDQKESLLIFTCPSMTYEDVDTFYEIVNG